MNASDRIHSGKSDQWPCSPIAVSIVVPTFNEAKNIPILVEKLSRTLTDLEWEVIFVDDASPDETAAIVRNIARYDRRIRLIARHNRRGLSSAVIEGALAGAGNTIAVMDGDLQHDEAILPAMIQAVRSGEVDMATASRFLRIDGADGLSSCRRRKISDTGVMLAQRAFRLELTDPLTGFFVTRREVIDNALPFLSEAGFKVLLDLLTANRTRLKIKEFPFVFRARIHGESKLDGRAIYDFMVFFIEKLFAWARVPLPGRFISFALINAIGIIIHMISLMFVVSLNIGTFATSQLFATFVAMSFNYTVNNAVTYRDRKLTGSKFYLGFLVFSTLCAIGVIGNISIASVVHRELEGEVILIPALLGAFITLVWNYVATKLFVWGRLTRTKHPHSRFSLNHAAQTRNVPSSPNRDTST